MKMEMNKRNQEKTVGRLQQYQKQMEKKLQKGGKQK